MLTRGMGYFADQEAVREVGREWTDTAGTFGRNNGKVLEYDIPGQQHTSHRTDREDRVAAGRNPRSVLNVSPEPLSLAHYAAFPTRLVEPLIKATCPRQCCPVCGAGWAAVVEREAGREWETPKLDGLATTGISTNGQGKSSLGASGGSKGWNAHGPKTHVLAYRPTCEYSREDSIPGLVLDPFCGSGSTLIAARWLGLHAVGCDLSAPYLRDIARARLELDALDAWCEGAGVTAESGDLGPLFEVRP